LGVGKMIRTVAIALVLLGCAMVGTVSDLRPVEVPVSIDLGRVTMHVVPSQAYFPQAGGCKDRHAIGCAMGREIWVIGYNTPGGLSVRWGVVLHELLHIGHWVDSRVANPDRAK